MLAKAGEGDRAIKVKMVSWVIDQFFVLSDFFFLVAFFFYINSPSTCSLENGKLGKPTEDETKILTFGCLFCGYIYIYINVSTLIMLHNLNPSH